MEPESADKQPYEVVSFRDKTSLMNSGAIVEYFDDEIRIRYRRPPFYFGTFFLGFSLFFVCFWGVLGLGLATVVVFGPVTDWRVRLSIGFVALGVLAIGVFIIMTFWKSQIPLFFDETFVLRPNSYERQFGKFRPQEYSYSDFSSILIFAFLNKDEASWPYKHIPSHFSGGGSIYVGIATTQSQYLHLPWRSPCDVFKNYQCLEKVNHMSILVERIHVLTGIPFHQPVCLSVEGWSRGNAPWPAFGKRTGYVFNAPLIINRDEWPSNDE